MRNKKKLISLIEKKMPEKDLFNRIENKIEVREKRRFNKPLFVSLLASCSVVLMAGSILIGGLGGGFNKDVGSSLPSIMEGEGDLAGTTTKPGSGTTSSPTGGE